MPSVEAMRYFAENEGDVAYMHDRWMKSKVVQEQSQILTGKAWQEVTTDERITRAIDKHYNEMAWYLYSRNYVDLGGTDRAKADICRQALEVKLAGNAGKGTPIEQFWNDVRSGKLILNTPAREPSKKSESPAPAGRAVPTLEQLNVVKDS